MENITLVDIITIVIIICIIVFLIKKAVGLALGIAAIFILFQIGFMFTGQDTQEKLNVNKYLESDAAQAVTSFFDDFARRREENKIVNTDEIYQGMVDIGEKAVDIAKDIFTKENIEKLADGISGALRDAGVKDITLEELCQIIADKFGTTPDDPGVQEVAEQVQANMAQ